MIMLASAIPTVIELATANHQKNLFVQGTLNIQRNAAVSTTVLRSAAKRQLTNQVTGLKVPQPKSGMIRERGNQLPQDSRQRDTQDANCR
jgi:hypothetical protein